MLLDDVLELIELPAMSDIIVLGDDLNAHRHRSVVEPRPAKHGFAEVIVQSHSYAPIPLKSLVASLLRPADWSRTAICAAASRPGRARSLSSPQAGAPIHPRASGRSSIGAMLDPPTPIIRHSRPEGSAADRRAGNPAALSSALLRPGALLRAAGFPGLQHACMLPSGNDGGLGVTAVATAAAAAGPSPTLPRASASACGAAWASPGAAEGEAAGSASERLAAETAAEAAAAQGAAGRRGGRR